jgi:four helix bundle protein
MVNLAAAARLLESSREHEHIMGMPKPNPVQEKSYAFALEVVQLSGRLQQGRQYEIARQTLRSGTAIGANVEEALAAVSRPEFIAKMSIASKEARECHYWLRLLRDAGLADTTRLVASCNELVLMLASIVKTSQRGTRAPPN